MKAFEEEQNEEKQNKKDHKKKDSLLLQEGVIGIIEIPSLDIKYPVFEGAGSVQLNEGIGHMTNTTELCGKGNCVLAGHNGSRRGVLKELFVFQSHIYTLFLRCSIRK